MKNSDKKTRVSHKNPFVIKRTFIKGFKNKIL